MENSFYYIIGFFVLLYYLWKRDNDQEKAEKAKRIFKRDKKLYNIMKQGLKEYNWDEKKNDRFSKWIDANDKDILFENIDVVVYKVKHFVEYRLGFYIKDTKEYGLYSSWEDFENFYRSDSTFTKEEHLMYDDDDDDY